MTRGSIKEYIEAVRWRYLRANKKEKGRILDEFTKVTGYHRKSAIRRLRQGNKPLRGKRRHGDNTMTAEVEAQLYQMSPSTIDRLLRPYRRLGGHRPLTTTKPGTLLKNSIPIWTFADWEKDVLVSLKLTWCPIVAKVPKAFT